MNNDLISRSELKTDLKQYFSDGTLESVSAKLAFNMILRKIDEAPTIEITEEQAIDKLHETGWLIRHDKEMTERPQGEWIAREDMDYLDENKVVHKHFECNKCGLIHDFIDGHTSQYNFCPECGARMQTKENLNG